jgi:galactitol PTS system EIIC component
MPMELFDGSRNLFPIVALPVVVLLLGLVLRIRPGKALSSAANIAIALLGISALLQVFLPGLWKAAQDIHLRTGLAATSVDLGWTVAAAVVWTWPFALAMIPLQVAINVLLVARGWTRCISVDLWNVWHKAFIGALVAGIFDDTRTGVAIGFVMAAIWTVLELITGDRTREQVYLLTGIPGIAVPHALFLDAVWMAPVLHVLERCEVFRRWDADASAMARKLGVLSEKYLCGLVFGLAFAGLAGYRLSGSLTLAVQCAAAVTLFPLVAGLLSRALTPFTEWVQSYLQRRFRGRALFVGLDWPVLSGVDAANWTRIALQVPALVVSLFLPGNTVLPLAGATVGSAVTAAAVLTQGNLPMTLVLSLLALPIHLWAASYFAPHLTRLAQQGGMLPAVAGQVTWLGIDGAGMRLLFFGIVEAFRKRTWLGVAGIAVTFVLVWYSLRLLESGERAAVLKTGGLPNPVLES